MTESRLAGFGFGLYDFFAYLLPAVLFVSPLVLAPDHVLGETLRTVREGLSAQLTSTPDATLLTSAMIVVCVAVLYAAGLLVHLAAKLVEERVIERRAGAPSKWLLQHDAASSDKKHPFGPPLNPHIQDGFQKHVAAHFGFPDAVPASVAWNLAYRYLAQEGLLGRTSQFLFLHNLSRGVSLVSFLWTVYFLSQLIQDGAPETAVAFVLSGVASVAFFRLRATYNRAVAEEAILAYFVNRAGAEAQGRAGNPSGNVSRQ